MSNSKVDLNPNLLILNFWNPGSMDISRGEQQKPYLKFLTLSSLINKQ